MKKIIVIIHFAVLIITAHAQSYNIFKPSVNANQFFNTLSSEVGLHSGQVSINIPLHTIKCKGLDIPISIAFNAGNINHQTESSSIGLGWSLLAGGVISATIKDIDDFSVRSRSLIEHQYNNTYFSDLISKITSNSNTDDISNAILHLNFDKQPDTYNYSFLGYSGSICFRLDKSNVRTGILYPNSSFKIEKTLTGFKVTDDNGTIFLFEDSESFTSTNGTISTCWFLSDIKTNKGGHVRFIYENESFTDFSTKEDAGAIGAVYMTKSTKRLKRIDYDYGHMEFFSDSRADMYSQKKWFTKNI